MGEVSLPHSYTRACYLILAVRLGLAIWPTLIDSCALGWRQESFDSLYGDAIEFTLAA